ncbi:hypothetical protein CPAST_c26250 [Clostridium pasteurianum DSM 525 = ATCC 6013]|uniref:Lipoprotein n=1 Tax=Clostridium pasteurianum DSM 525 = ATCC 6013 TaxID=1262449 RepID=A0A0H3J9F0_CLOPA|nr:hypothetical protein [Clostridium pasteurianum]AJA48693.1 hypothetical protein CPAST_c26250 [Clostridium pasteurianum DSM 525 = ATCC 6013]AJA52681.1 hypothetical protein CLPA_c26250 [Clostridium pasteurianum DSM 525 = ATCC 6013]AOZ75919.1 hypothetical protein AQ983_12755 [Clostridium pasteurianum DSM 525 = ATCC 6013]AOZ79715.1 hypothetical protein AQ984_12750 [Clostridium pasteurianum]ELP59992.1 hypothetical protein F502_05132 [Clostridium pasteurianum DSM 525 = ATCC 6013]
MKKSNKIVSAIIAASLSVLIFAGCQSNSSTSSQNSTKKSTEEKTANSEEMQKNFESKLKELVSAGTITEAQSTKILSTLTSDMSKMGNKGQRSNRERENPLEQGSSVSPENKDEENTTGNEQGQVGHARNNPLSQLISDGVITEDQANKVMSALMGDRQNSNDTNKSTSSNVTNQ